MYFEDSFGSRQSPSIAEAMRTTPQFGQQWVLSSAGSTPNTHTQQGIKSSIGSSSQQIIEPMLRCSPTIVEPAYNSQPPQILSSFDQSLEEIEKKLCVQLDETLKMNYKKMKNKIKKVKYRVQQTDGSIHRIQELIESVYEHIDDAESFRNTMNNNPVIMNELSSRNRNENLMSGKAQKKISWRRGCQNKIFDLPD